MAISTTRERLPEVRTAGTHEELGRARGLALGTTIRTALAAAQQELAAAEISLAELERRLAPHERAAQAYVPHILAELRATAEAAEVPWLWLFYLSAGGHVPAAPRMAADGQGSGHVDRCTTMVSVHADGVVVAHSEDGAPAAIDDLYVADEHVIRPDGSRRRILALNYAYTLPGCAIAMNDAGLITALDMLWGPAEPPGVPCDLLTRAILDEPDIDAALELLHSMPCYGGASILLAQGTRAVQVELTGGKLATRELRAGEASAHTNHFVMPGLEAHAGKGDPESERRLGHAQVLAEPGFDRERARLILSNRQGYPDSVCRDRSLAGAVADTRTGLLELCLGEVRPGVSWAAYTL